MSRFVLRAHSLTELVRLGTMSGQCARFLEAAVVSGLNIVVAGATQSGKTTTLQLPRRGHPAARTGDHLRGFDRSANNPPRPP